MVKTKQCYTTININISLVSVNVYKRPSALANSSITVKNADTMTELQDGEFIEDSQKVVFSISPAKGYYISGKKTENDLYRETLKYSDYKNDYQEIISNHVPVKYYVITVDESDNFASYQYTLDGKIAKGSVYAKEGQKLKLKYTITDGVHTLAEPAGGFVFGWGASNTEQTEELEITSAYDGKTITLQHKHRTELKKYRPQKTQVADIILLKQL